MKVGKLSQFIATFASQPQSQQSKSVTEKPAQAQQLDAEAAPLKGALKNESPEQRQARVDSIRKRVDDGSYLKEVPTTEIAKKVYAELA